MEGKQKRCSKEGKKKEYGKDIREGKKRPGGEELAKAKQAKR